jgi:membrane peptidoglycan carboxypeptidase
MGEDLRVEGGLSKDEILELYLNSVYLERSAPASAFSPGTVQETPRSSMGY